MTPHHGRRTRLRVSRFPYQGRETGFEFPEAGAQPLARGERDTVEKRPQRRQHGTLRKRSPDQVFCDRAGVAFTPGVQSENTSSAAGQP